MTGLGEVRERMIFTIGYEQATQLAIVATLRDAGVEVLPDIRYMPLSRPSSSP